MPMVIGILQVELSIRQSQSLKDKRRIVASLKDRLHHDHQVSAAEVDHQDDPQRAMIGIALAGSDSQYCQSVLHRILDKLRVHRECVLADHALEIMPSVR